MDSQHSGIILSSIRHIWNNYFGLLYPALPILKVPNTLCGSFAQRLLEILLVSFGDNLLPFWMLSGSGFPPQGIFCPRNVLF